MLRICITVTQEQMDGLKVMSDLTGVPQSEIVRRSINKTLEKSAVRSG